jgi:lipopolysaccharide biosynthesis protein
LQLQLVDEYCVKVEEQRVQVVGLVQAWQLAITVEHLTQVFELEFKYSLEEQMVQLAPLVPLAQRVQKVGTVQVRQLVIADPQERQVLELR